jgi:hypothetical protein
VSTTQPPREDAPGSATGPGTGGDGGGPAREPDHLSEERSAALLAGDRPTSSFTTVTPAGPGWPGAEDRRDEPRDGGDRRREDLYGRADRSGRDDRYGSDDRTSDDERTSRGEHRAGTEPDPAVILDGATEARPRSRAKHHVWSVLLTLLLVPVAWYLLADAGARLTLPEGNPWETGTRNLAALGELAGGLVVLAVVLLAARWSSLGAIVTGVLVLVVGVPFVAAPRWTQSLLEPVTDRLDSLDALDSLGGNLAHHLLASGSTGRLVVYGLALVLVGVVSHGARRQGRREGQAARGR